MQRKRITMPLGVLGLGLATIVAATDIPQRVNKIFFPEASAQTSEKEADEEELTVQLYHPAEDFSYGAWNTDGSRQNSIPVNLLVTNPLPGADLEVRLLDAAGNVVQSTTRQNVPEGVVKVNENYQAGSALEGAVEVVVTKGKKRLASQTPINVTPVDLFVDYTSTNPVPPAENGLTMVRKGEHSQYIGPAEEGQRGRYFVLADSVAYRFTVTEPLRYADAVIRFLAGSLDSPNARAQVDVYLRRVIVDATTGKEVETPKTLVGTLLGQDNGTNPADRVPLALRKDGGLLDPGLYELGLIMRPQPDAQSAALIEGVHVVGGISRTDVRVVARSEIERDYQLAAPKTGRRESH